MPDLVEIVQQPPAVIEVTQATSALVEVVTAGPQGPPGPAGAAGTVYLQEQPAASWPIPHGLGRPASTACFDPSGERIYPDEYATDTFTTLVFPTPMAGTAVLF